MLAARRLQNGCPSCTAQILRLYVHSIAEIAPAAAATRTSRNLGSQTRFRGRRHDAHFLSTSSRRSQEGSTDKHLRNSRPDRSADEVAQLSTDSREETVRNTHPDEALGDLTQPPEEELPEELAKENFSEELAEDEFLEELLEEDLLDELPETQDPETMVRQAKRMFRDTLPAGYLSAEEYNLYERLYGAPLRQTAPEDVGFGSFGEAAEEEEAKNAAKNLLFREDPRGLLEQVEYTVESRPVEVRISGEDGETVVVEEEDQEALEARPPNDTQLSYIEANASNRREYNALLRLQKDFEATRIRAAQEVAQLELESAAEEAEEHDEVDEEEDIEEDEGDEESAELDERFAWYPSHEGPRLHEYTREGRFNTSPKTLFLPKDNFIEPITELLKRADTKHVLAAAEKSFGGPGLPHSPATPRFGRNLQQKGLGIGANHHKISEIEADAFIAAALPGIYASVMSALVETRKRLGPEWLRGLLNRKDGDGVGPRILDAGAGGAGLAAWQEVLQAEWDILREKDADLAAAPPGKRTVVVGSGQLRYRISRFLENTTFLPRLPNYAQVDNSDQQLDAPEVPQKRKVYDIIIATHLLVPLEKEWRRKEVLDNLWSMLSPEGGVLIVLEKGHPRGFEAVADVRQRLLDEFILAPTPHAREDTTEPEMELRVREPGMIVAPCTNHFKCPMYLTRGMSPGRKDFCHFSQRFVRPQFLQRVLGSSHRNHEDINFSFIAVRRGMPTPNTAGAEPTPNVADLFSSPVPTSDSAILTPKLVLQGEAATKAALAGYESTPTSSDQRPHPLSLPRSILPPLKRKGHVTLDLCTPSGSIERWTVPKSFSRQAYHDARKSRWGDLWALGAKTRVRRAVRLGRGVKEGETVPNDGGVRAARAAALNGMVDAKGRKRGKARPKVVEIGLNDKGVFQERVKGIQGKRPERRTKGGRKPPRERNLLRLEED